MYTVQVIQLNMNDSENIHKCTRCDYKSKWRSNVTRHMVTKHITSNDMLPAAKNMLPAAKNILPAANNMLTAANDIGASSHNKQCDKCQKVFTRRYSMLKHHEKCEGERNPLQCQHCLKHLKYKNNLAAHMKRCKSTALVVANSQRPPQPSDTFQQQVSSITNNNNTTNNNTNNIININVQAPMVFKENTPYQFDHITKKTIKQLLKNDDYSELMDAFSKDVLRRCENQCVRKTNLRSSSSSVHVGNNVWEMQSDANVIPKMLCNLAITLSGSIEECKVAAKATLETFIEDLTCYGEHGNEEKDEIVQLKKLYKKTMGDLKHNIFNITRQAIGAQKAMAMLT